MLGKKVDSAYIDNAYKVSNVIRLENEATMSPVILLELMFLYIHKLVKNMLSQLSCKYMNFLLVRPSYDSSKLKFILHYTTPKKSSSSMNVKLYFPWKLPCITTMTTRIGEIPDECQLNFKISYRGFWVVNVTTPLVNPDI